MLVPPRVRVQLINVTPDHDLQGRLDLEFELPVSGDTLDVTDIERRLRNNVFPGHTRALCKLRAYRVRNPRRGGLARAPDRGEKQQEISP
jgi:hypothetical protein